MANICLYKIKVYGTKKACHKLIDMMPLYSSEKEIILECGTDDHYSLIFTGDCKWSVDSYTTHCSVTKLSEEEIDKIEDGDYWNIPLKEKSILLDCEIFCNSKDIDSSGYADYVHFDKGKKINDECPNELHIKRGRDYDQFGNADYISSSSYSDEVVTTCRVKFEDGRSYWYQGEFEVNDLVFVEGAKKDCRGKVIETKEERGCTGYYHVIEKIGHINPFIEYDILNIWDSFNTKERKKYLTSIGLDESITKKKFLTLIENKWNDYALKNNKWEDFIKTLK